MSEQQFRIVMKNHRDQVIHIYEGDKKQMKRFMDQQVDILSKLLDSEKSLNINIMKLKE